MMMTFNTDRNDFQSVFRCITWMVVLLCWFATCAPERVRTPKALSFHSIFDSVFGSKFFGKTYDSFYIITVLIGGIVCVFYAVLTLALIPVLYTFILVKLTDWLCHLAMRTAFAMKSHLQIVT